MPGTKQLKFLLERETKGAVRYAEVGYDDKPLEMQDATIGTLYIRKSAIGTTIPQRILVTVEL